MSSRKGSSNHYNPQTHNNKRFLHQSSNYQGGENQSYGGPPSLGNNQVGPPIRFPHDLKQGSQQLPPQQQPPPQVQQGFSNQAPSAQPQTMYSNYGGPIGGPANGPGPQVILNHQQQQQQQPQHFMNHQQRPNYYNPPLMPRGMTNQMPRMNPLMTNHPRIGLPQHVPNQPGQNGPQDPQVYPNGGAGNGQIQQMPPGTQPQMQQFLFFTPQPTNFPPAQRPQQPANFPQTPQQMFPYIISPGINAGLQYASMPFGAGATPPVQQQMQHIQHMYPPQMPQVQPQQILSQPIQQQQQQQPPVGQNIQSQTRPIPTPTPPNLNQQQIPLSNMMHAMMPQNQMVQQTPAVYYQQPMAPGTLQTQRQPLQPPRKRVAAIKITNPDTGEEIDLTSETKPAVNNKLASESSDATDLAGEVKLSSHITDVGSESSSSIATSTSTLTPGQSAEDVSAKPDIDSKKPEEPKANNLDVFETRSPLIKESSPMLSDKPHSENIHTGNSVDHVNRTEEIVDSPSGEFKPINPAPITDLTDDEDPTKSRSKPKSVVTKKKDPLERMSTGNDSESFKDASSTTASTSSTAFVSPATTPDVSSSPGMVKMLDSNSVPRKESPLETNHINEVPEQRQITPQAVTSPNDRSNHESHESTPGNDKDEEENNSSSKSSSLMKLKYQYKGDQWSPINVEGKKQYDRDFLIQLQNDPLSLLKPHNLPAMDIVKDRSQMAMMMVKSNKDWMPEYAKAVGGSSTKKPPMFNQVPRDIRENKRPPPKIIDVKIEKVELHQTENAWRPSLMATTDTTANGDLDQSSMDVLTRKARGILNKLCPQKFDILVKKFSELPIDSEEKLKLCMELIFEKAVDEPGFSVAYAQMCSNLQKTQAVIDGSGQAKPMGNFRKLLVSRCQQEFEKNYMDGMDKAKYEESLKAATTEEARKEIQLDWEEKERCARRRSLGNIRFIGELYKLKMLTYRIMHECVRKLLGEHDEESLECLCRLLTTVGKDLETETQEKFKTNPEDCTKQGVRQFDEYFKQIGRIIEKKNISSRVKFMLQDLIDLRRNQWKPRRDVAGPKTIDQIHQEVEREKTQQQLMNEMPRTRDRDMGPGSQMRSGGPNDIRKKPIRGPNSEEGWQNVPSKAPQRAIFDKIDANKISNLAHSSARRMDAENMQFGPTRTNLWGQGSSSMKASRSKDDHMSNMSNKFSSLDSGPVSFSGYPSMPPPSHDNFDSRRGSGGPSRSMGPTGGRSSRGPSAENDRRRVLDAISKSGFGSKQPNNNNNGPRDPSDGISLGGSASMFVSSRSPTDVLEQKNKLQAGPMSEEEFQKQSKLLIDEFLSSGDEKDAINVICERFPPARMTNFVDEILNKVLESCLTERIKVGTFLGKLISQHIVLSSQFETVTRTLLESASDLVVDIPKFWDYLGELLAPMFASGSLPLSFLLTSGLSSENGYPSKYLVGVLNAIAHHAGHEKLVQLWRTSNIELEKFMPKEDIPAFVETNKMNFLLEMSVERFREDLTMLLEKDPKNNDEIMSWIKREVGLKCYEKPYIRMLITVLVEHCRKGDNHPATLAAVLERKNILMHFLDSKVEREIQAMYALQRLMQKWEHPSKLFYTLLEGFNDLSIISDDACKAWEKCDDPAEQDGKGVAITSITQFLIWLHENAED